jgi:hypothetical protein
MVLLYSPSTTPRLNYIASFIFSDRLGTSFRIIDNTEELLSFDGPRINYSGNNFCSSCFHILPGGFMQEQGIRTLNPEYRRYQELHLLFPTSSADCPFDLFSACFYLISRYEEYLPHSKDSYGRFAHGESLAYRSGFLEHPVVDQWIAWLADQLKKKFPGCHFQPPGFLFLPTYDIDNAYAVRNKSILRTIGGFLRSPSLQRMRILTGHARDPYDCYDFLDELHARYGLKPLYFFLAAKHIGGYDKNIERGTALSVLIGRHARKYSLGLHPGWQSGDSEAVFHEEKKYLESVAQTEIHRSRQHFIRFNLPEGYRRLIKEGITDDYSMGYGSINGFRASTGASFYWYDLENEAATALRVHPFCFMEANSYYEQQYTPVRALEELLHYFRVCKEAGAPFTTIWHNHFLGSEARFAGWRETYEAFIAQICR